MKDSVISCQKCILPSSLSTIKFDDKGVCNYCRQWDKEWSNAPVDHQDKFKTIMEKTRDPKNTYDCISGLSGGKDSCYVIYLGHQFGLRQLAVTFDNGFISEEGQNNIDAIVTHFSLGHVIIKPGWELLKKMYRHSLLQTGEFCSVCNVGIRAALYRVAIIYNIKTILAGTSARTEAMLPQEFFTCSDDYFANVFKGYLTQREINHFKYLGHFERAAWNLTGKMRTVYVPRYVPWKEDHILSVLSGQTGWKGNLWQQHTDCTMSKAKEYLNIRRNGFSEKVGKLSSLVRDGQITRDKALELAEKEEAEILNNEKEIQEKMATVFELTNDEVKKVIRTRHQSFLESSFTGKTYSTLKKLFKK